MKKRGNAIQENRQAKTNIDPLANVILRGSVTTGDTNS
jgi:hypothetical protein